MAAAVQVTEREVVTCRKCHLVQYKRASGCCPRCLKPYVQPTQAPQPAPSGSPVPPEVPGGALSRPTGLSDPAQSFSDNIRSIRDAQGISQATVGKRMGIARSYINKLENARMIPTLRQLPRLAAALGVETIDILPPVLSRAEDVFEIKLSRLVGKLNEEQRIQVLEYVQLLSERKTPNADHSERRISA